MHTMVRRAAAELSLEVIPSRRTYALWTGCSSGEMFTPASGVSWPDHGPTPAPVRPTGPPARGGAGGSWSWATLPGGLLQEAGDWPMGFSGLIPLPPDLSSEAAVPGLRLFSRSRALAMAGWLGGLEPVRLLVEERQLLLEAGQDDRWLVSDLESGAASEIESALSDQRTDADCSSSPFRAVQRSGPSPASG